jgi:hypothetical protein
MVQTLPIRIAGHLADQHIVTPEGDDQFSDAFRAAASAPLFQVAGDQVTEFMLVTAERPDFVVVPPFPIFRISANRKDMIRAYTPHNPGAFLLECVVFGYDDEIIIRNIVDCTDGRGNWSMFGATLRVRADGGVVESDPEHRLEVPDVGGLGEPLEKIALFSCATLLGMLYILDHREVRITDVAAPINRQQRRAAERKGEPVAPTYVVRIPNHITISQVGRDLEQGRNRRKVRPHERRAHMRRDRAGNKTIRVRNSRINCEPGARCAYPIYNVAGVQIGGAA